MYIIGIFHNVSRDSACLRIHLLRSFTNLRESGWLSDSLGVQKQTYSTDMHTLPEYGNMANNRKRSVTYLISRLESSALRERYMQAMQANTFGFEH